MSGGGITEGIVEDAALEYFRALGYQTVNGPLIAPDGDSPERESYQDVFLRARMHRVVTRINPQLPDEVIEQAIAQVFRAESQNVLSENERLHRLLTDGVPVEHRGDDGATRTVLVWLIDWDHAETNDWLAVNQFTIVEGKNRRPDILVFLNGIPISLLELKNPGDENATLKGAWNQVQTYRNDIPSVFTPNALTVVSDGTSASMSSFTAGWEHFAPWKTIHGRELVTDRPALEVLIRGVFEPVRLLDIIRNFIVFSDEHKASSNVWPNTTSIGR